MKNMTNIMKGIRHRTLECSSSVFQAKREFLIRECSPWTDKRGLVLIRRENVDFIIAIKAVNKGKYFTPHTILNDLIDERGGIIILRTGPIDIMIIKIDTNCSLFLIHRNNVRNPLCQRNWINETRFEKFFNFSFYGSSFLRMHWK